jgi:hypothetical protein
MLTSSATVVTAPRTGIARVSGQALRSGSAEPLSSLLERNLGVIYRGAITREECEAFVDCVYEAREHWIENFGGASFTLGRAYYTDLEQGREATYFEQAESSDAIVERVAPGLASRVYDLFGAAVGAWVEQREGWCGPGVHVFPPLGGVAREGGEIHYDTEGLLDAELAVRAPAVTCVLMLQPAEFGGGLRVWDQCARGDERVQLPEPGVRSEIIHYAPGDLAVIDSYRLHQIMPFGGAAERVSATAHAVWTGQRWEVWF